MEKRLLCLFISVIIIFFSCSKKGEVEEPPEGGTSDGPRTELTLNEQDENGIAKASSEDEIPVIDPSGGNEVNDTGSGAEVTGSKSSGSEKNNETVPISSQEKLPRRIINNPVLPEDMKIGLLFGGKNSSEGKEKAMAVERLEIFLENLSEGTVSDQFFSTGSADYLSRIMVSVIENELFHETSRIGTPVLEDESCVRINVRLFGNPGRTSGEVLLCMEDGKWMITDIQINFEKLLNNYEKEFDIYEPRVYRWLELY